MKPLVVSSGEPAGIGPDLCLALCGYAVPLVVVASPECLLARAHQLQVPLHIEPYRIGQVVEPRPDTLTVWPIDCAAPVVCGELNTWNVPYVLAMLEWVTEQCVAGVFDAVVTAPIQKSIINAAGIPFTGHTEFFADNAGASAVMLLVADALRVALVTTHLPLRAVPDHITIPAICRVVRTLHLALCHDFGIADPLIAVTGLNPHAGEGGYLGQEEITVIMPAIQQLQAEGLRIVGPESADTVFVSQDPKPDAVVVMYHDQGLPVLKYAGFGHAVNVTLGLPFIRTSVDHGTALSLAGRGLARPDSLLAAVSLAAQMCSRRGSDDGV